MNFKLFTRRRIVIVCVLLIVVIFIGKKILSPEAPNWITETVTKGDVSTTVAVTGTIQADNTADLAFPTSGIIREILVR